VAGVHQSDLLALRRGVLAVSVLHDVDIEPHDDGVLLPRQGSGPGKGIWLTWSDLSDTCGPHHPLAAAGTYRLVGLFRLLALVSRLGADAPGAVRAAAGLVALPRDHVDHLGDGWVVEPLRGGALDLGIGVRGLVDDLPTGRTGRTRPAGAAGEARGSAAVMPLPAIVLRQLGVQAGDWWPGIRAQADRWAALAVEQLGQDGRHAGQLLPVSGSDVLALLAGPQLRAALAQADGSGMRAVAAPTRLRSWYDLSRIDPAYVAAVWAITSDAERGIPSPLLVTKDEVVVAQQRGDLVRPAFDAPLAASWRQVSPRRPGSPSSAPGVPRPRRPGG